MAFSQSFPSTDASTEPWVARPQLALEAIGTEASPIVIIDGFAPDPDSLCAVARQTPLAPLGDYYPGVRGRLPAGYLEQVLPLLSPVLRRVYGFDGKVRVLRSLVSMATSHSSELTLAQRVPHIDGTSGSLIAIIHYLFVGDQGGTAFFRQRSTGIERVSADRHQLFLSAMQADFNRDGEPESGYVGFSSPHFERIGMVEPQYNRAAIYPGNLLHCAALPNDRRLEPSPQSGRLTIATFLETA